MNEKKVLELLIDGKFADADCDSLVTFLGIGTNKLKTLKADSASSRSLLIAAISFWLQNDLERSWKKLADAVEKCEYKVLAEYIRKRIAQGEQTTMIMNSKCI